MNILLKRYYLVRLRISQILLPRWTLIFTFCLTDNPSYFSLPTEAHKKSRHTFLRKWSESKNSATLPANSDKKAVGGSRRNFKSLIRANSEDTQLLVLGKPRPSDLAPSVYLNRQQRHRSTGNVIGSNDLLHQDMVHCGGVADDDGDVFLSNNANIQYYNTSTLPVKRILTSGRRRHSIGSLLNRDRTSLATNTDTDVRSRETPIRRKFKHINVDKGRFKIVHITKIKLPICN